jgi:PAS domain S-box-containing protein
VIRSHRFPIARALLLLVFLLGPVIGLPVYRLAAAEERDRNQIQLDHEISAIAVAIDSELKAVLEVLHGLQTLFELEGPVSRAVFTDVAGPVLARHPSLQALEWAPRVDRGARVDHELALRAEGYPDYSITEQQGERLVPAAAGREVFFPVVYLEPFADNAAALGFDLAADQVRGKAIARASEADRPTLSDPIPLVQRGSPSLGVLALLAVHAGGFPPTPQQGPPRGFLVAVFDVARLLQNTGFSVHGGSTGELRIELIDDDVAGRPLTMYQSAGGLDPAQAAALEAEQVITVGGQAWRLVVRPTAPYVASLETGHPPLLGAAATLTWWLSFGLVAAVGRRARSRLERRHARLVSNILDSLSDGVIVASTNGTIVTANRAAVAVAGRDEAGTPPSEWSRTFGFFVPGTDRMFPADELPLTRAIRGESSDCIEVFVRNPQVPEGTYVSVSGAPIRDGRGAVRGGVVVFRDISERRRTEERLRRLSSAVEQTADSVLITDRQGTIEYVNPAFEATTGYTSGEALGQTPKLLKSGKQDDAYYRELWATILCGEPFRGTTVNRKKDGKLYFAEQTITAIRDSEGNITHFVSVLKDMTERRKVQEQEIELQLAAEVQQHLFPRSPPQISGYDLAGSVFPAAATCGDYFDFIPGCNGELALVIADVSGHGLGPALVMAETRAYLRSLTRTVADLAEVASSVNRFLEDDLQENYFVTMLLARLEPESGRLTWVNCAHPSGHVIDASGRVAAELSSKCLPLGLFRDRWRCVTNETVLGDGDVAILVTDGALENESSSGEMFGAHRYLEVVAQHRTAPAAEIVAAVRSALWEFMAGDVPVDDVTIVVCKRLKGAT